MTDSPLQAIIERDTRKRFNLPGRILSGLVAAALVVIASAGFSYRALLDGEATAEQVARTLNVVDQLQVLLSNLKDAETGQRGYLLTGTENYLAPYTVAQTTIPSQLALLRSISTDSPRQVARFNALEPLVADKLAELRETVTLRRSGDLDGALAIVRSDRGKVAMDGIRRIVADMQGDERTLLDGRRRDSDAATQTSFRLMTLGAVVLLLLIAMAGLLLARSHREREIESWLRAGVAGIAAQLLGEKRLDSLCAKALSYLSRYVEAPFSTLYTADQSGRLHRVAGYAAGAAALSTPATVEPGEGLLG